LMNSIGLRISSESQKIKLDIIPQRTLQNDTFLFVPQGEIKYQVFVIPRFIFIGSVLNILRDQEASFFPHLIICVLRKNL